MKKDLSRSDLALTSLTDRSRAVGPLAQLRSRAEGLTGWAIYAEGRFFQWLEGPAHAVSRLWSSVRHDRRHTDIQDCSILPAPARVFGG